MVDPHKCCQGIRLRIVSEPTATIDFYICQAGIICNDLKIDTCSGIDEASLVALNSGEGMSWSLGGEVVNLSPFWGADPITEPCSSLWYRDYCGGLLWEVRACPVPQVCPPTSLLTKPNGTRFENVT